MDNTKPTRTKEQTKQQPLTLKKDQHQIAGCPTANFPRSYHEQSVFELQQSPHFDGIIYEDEDDCESFDSMETASDNIPVWVHGEQRWISGVNDNTTCADLVNALLADEGIPIPGHNHSRNQQGVNTMTKSALAWNRNKRISDKACYAITERWKRSEHIVPDDTKVLQMLSAWGRAKKEPKLTLRQIDPHKQPSWTNSSNDKDSGMSSPIGSSSSAIIRRRKHRASKSTTAWLTEAHTIHPKSHRATIDKLMKLILVQGETIQQQLAKLRDRELQIAKIEDERHRIREKEIGKNYLLETYLNGLHEADDKNIVTVHSDSGVQTDAGGVPANIPSPNDDNYVLREGKATIVKDKLRQHPGTEVSGTSECVLAEVYENDLLEKIEWMEKLVLVNKHLQREEELMARLGAKIRKYESMNPVINENQILDDLVKVNANIEANSCEMKKIDDDLQLSNEQLKEKIRILENLSIEFTDVEQASETVLESLESDPIELPNAKFPQDLFHLSQYISKPNYEFNENNENFSQKLLYAKPTPSDLNLLAGKHSILPPPHAFANENLPELLPILVSHPRISQAPIVNCKNKNPICMSMNTATSAPSAPSATSINFLHKNAQGAPQSAQSLPCRPNGGDIDNQNIYATASRAMGKFGPKRLINGAFNEFESNSDTGLSSMGEDITQLGTLV